MDRPTAERLHLISSPSKADLRALALSRRDGLDPAFRIEASLAIADLFDPALFAVAGRVVSGFLPIRSEVDARPTMDRCRLAGAALCLPVFASRTDPMRFRVLERGAALVSQGFGTAGPGPEAAEADPDMILAPLAAFDRRGHRIGYGKGHYDEALARLDAARRRLVVGLAFSIQEVDDVPAEPHDRRLDAVITEQGVIRFGSA